MAKEVKIKTGTIGKINRGMLGKTTKLIYSGMPNNQSFTISPIISTETLTGSAQISPIIYYHIESTIINILEEAVQIKNN